MRDGRPTRWKIHQAALALFVDKGVTETTVRDIAAAAGVAEGTLYRHYVSKDALVADLFTLHYAEVARTLEAIRLRPQPFADRLAAMIDALCRFYDEAPILFRFLLLVQHQALPRVTRQDGNPVAVVRKAVADAAAAGEITLADPDLGTAFLFGLLLQPATFLVYGRLQGPLSAFAPAITGAAWRSLNP